jgi:hypothetical protein
MGDAVSIWTLFQQNTLEYLLAVRFLELSEKGPLSVRISDKSGALLQIITAGLACG